MGSSYSNPAPADREGLPLPQKPPPQTPRRLKMLCRCVVPLLVFHLLVREMSAFVLPKATRAKREVSLLNPDFPHVEANPGDLSPGDDPWELEGHRTHAGIVLLPRLDLPPTSHQDPPHSHRRSQEKRRKLAPMDSIGSSLMSGNRNRKEASSNHWEEYS
ncbi:unnamed protein product [Arctogadus glacialis]